MMVCYMSTLMSSLLIILADGMGKGMRVKPMEENCKLLQEEKRRETREEENKRQRGRKETGAWEREGNKRQK